MISIIVAYDQNRVIGNQGDIPWKISEEFKHFKRTTVNNSCIMGRKTWDSLPDNYKPLPNRSNIVVSRNVVDGVVVKNSLEEAIDFAKKVNPDKEIFIIGGAQIYQQSLDKGFVDRVLASEIKSSYEGDVYFPKINSLNSRLIQEFDEFKIIEYIMK